MAVYAKGDKFMASVGTGATRTRKTFDTESAALIWEQQQDTARAAIKALPEPTCWTLSEAFSQTLRHEWRGKGGEKASTINATSAVAFFGPDTLCSEITATRVVEWMEELEDVHENSGATRNRKLSALMTMLKRAELFGGLKTLPRSKRCEESEHRMYWFTDADEAAMLQAARTLGYHELSDFIIIGLDTGFRCAELLGLTLRDYHNGVLVLHAGATKSGKARSVSCRPRVREIIERRISLGTHRVFPQLSPGVLRSQWASLRATLGRSDDPGFIPHVLRHTCATRLVSKGVPLPVVQAWMGHKVIATTMRYAHVIGGQMEAAMQALDSPSNT